MSPVTRNSRSLRTGLKAEKRIERGKEIMTIMIERGPKLVSVSQSILLWKSITNIIYRLNPSIMQSLETSLVK